MTQPASFLWYDYETWGTHPRRDGIAQFAAVRTTPDLDIIGEPVDLKCKPLPDTVIDPNACLITGLTPQDCEQDGLDEWRFAERIETLMAEPGTCTVGYNSLRFDDEFTRSLFYRNLLDPYSREWRNGNSRWDLLDVVRLTYALRPDGIEWPVHDDGRPSFKLEHLSSANGLEHANAHDAVSDVLATIAVARLIRDRQPKLFDYALSLRRKQTVRSLLPLERHEPVLHVTGMVPAERGCLSVVLPLSEHPDRSNEIIVLDLAEDPTWLLDHNADELRDWLYCRADAMPEGGRRPPLRTLHINRSPMIAPYRMLDDRTCERFDIDRGAIERHRSIVDRWQDLVELGRRVFQREAPEPAADPEHALYEGFIDKHDRSVLNRLRAATNHPERWPGLAEDLHDRRLPTLVFNARARHWFDSLTDEERGVWRESVIRNLTQPDWGSHLTLAEAQAETRALLEHNPEDTVLTQVSAWLEQQRRDWLEEKPDTLSAPASSHAEPDAPDQQLGLFDDV